ncbi:MAG: hypothetical protein GY928_17040 [Colwellia sp.]|nr:hypothetical protein [Colwellia sp.]
MNITKWLAERVDTKGNVNAEEVESLFRDIKDELGSVLEFDDRLPELEEGMYCLLPAGYIPEELRTAFQTTHYQKEGFIRGNLHLQLGRWVGLGYNLFQSGLFLTDEPNTDNGLYKEIPYEEFLRLLKENK